MHFKNKAKHLLVLGLLLALMCFCTGCTSNNESGNNSGDMAGTEAATPSPSPSATPMDDNMNNDNGNVNTDEGLLDDTGNAVGNVIEDAGNTVGNVTEDVADGVGNMVDDITGTNDTGSTTSTTANLQNRAELLLDSFCHIKIFLTLFLCYNTVFKSL